MDRAAERTVCAVAIVSGEAAFIEEWIAYHRLLGVDRFFLYDNDPRLPLRPLLEDLEYVTVIDWPGDPTATWPGDNLQTRTYTHALELAAPFRWVTFLDVDEFIVLRRHGSLSAFLSGFEGFGSVRLNWHVFGHNGYYDDPRGLVTSALTRRMASPSVQTKAITRPEAVAWVAGAHFCRLKGTWQTADGNGRAYSDELYPGKTDVAHVNHYQCRSFLSWMGRVARGDVSFDRSTVPHEHAWRLDDHLCLRQFVETVARDKNELVDDYMRRFEEPILELLGARGLPGRPFVDPPRLEQARIMSAIDGTRPARSLVSRAVARFYRGRARRRLAGRARRI